MNVTTPPPPTTRMPEYERGILITYDVFSTILTIGLNAVVIALIVTRVKIGSNPSCIPVFVASILGLFNGFGFTLMITLSLILGDWPGSMRWCEIAEVLHKHIVYSIIYCATVVSLEAAYTILRPLSYDRSGGVARVIISIATCVAVTILLPIQVCHFFYMKPGQIEETWGTYLWNLFKDSTFLYIRRNKYCIRLYFPGTFDADFISFFVLITNMTAIGLVITSYVVIFAMVVQSRRMFGSTSNEAKTRQKAQNVKIAKAAIIMTSCTLLPWLPNPILAITMRFTVVTDWLVNAMGVTAYWAMIDTSNYLYYIVPWLFPLLNLLKNPTIVKAIKSMRTKSYRGTASAGTGRSTVHSNYSTIGNRQPAGGPTAANRGPPAATRRPVGGGLSRTPTGPPSSGPAAAVQNMTIPKSRIGQLGGQQKEGQITQQKNTLVVEATTTL